MHKKCLTCRFLGQCTRTNFVMVYTGDSCPDWLEASSAMVWARVQAYKLVGNLSIPVMLKGKASQIIS